MNLLVDTSAWSLAFRRDSPSDLPVVAELRRALDGTGAVVTTGIVVQELLQGVRGPKSKDLIIERLSVLPWVVPDRQDHLEAAALHGVCRRKGVQVGTIDVLLAQLCLRHDLAILTADRDFRRIGELVPIRVVPDSS